MTPRASLASVAAGVLLVVIGLVGAFTTGSGDDEAPVAVTSTSTQTSTTVAPVETPQELYAVLEAAFRDGDVDTLFERLDAAVLEAYGADQCRAYLAALGTRTITFEVVAVRAQESWRFGERDDLEISVANAIPVDLVTSVDGTAGPQQEAHLHEVAGTLRWFTDCGDPV